MSYAPIAGRAIATLIGLLSIPKANRKEAYVDRIQREFPGLLDRAQAQAIDDSNRAYWENLYGSNPLTSWNHPASPPRSLLPHEAAARDPGYDYLGPSPSHSGAFGRFGTGGQFSPGSATALRDAVVRCAA